MADAGYAGHYDVPSNMLTNTIELSHAKHGYKLTERVHSYSRIQHCPTAPIYRPVRCL